VFLRHLSVYQRLSLIIAILSFAMIAVAGAQLLVLQNTVVEERQAKVREMVDVAKAVLSAYDEKARSGAIAAEDARRLAFDAIGAMRWGRFADYFGI
jgi:methyl-accepting chemotaxis protein